MSIHTILSQGEKDFEEKFFARNGEMKVETFLDVKEWIKSFATRIVEEVGKELIGDDEKVPEDVQWKGIHFINEHKPIHRNQLRSEQRTKLQKMKG